MNQEELYKLQKKADEYIASKNSEGIVEIINKIEDTIENEIQLKTSLYYILGNCYKKLHLIKVKKENNFWDYEQNELFKSIYYHRKYIGKEEFKHLDLPLKIGLLTNLGNSFNRYGRPIEAIRYFDKAFFEHNFEKELKSKNIIYENFLILLVNKGGILEDYAKERYDNMLNSHILNKESYKYFIKAIKKIDLYIEKLDNNLTHTYINNIKKTVEKKCKSLEDFYGLDFLNENEMYDEYELSKNKKEKKYQKWCLQNKLYLNPMNDIKSYPIDCKDILNLPTLTTPIESGFPIYITYFNQIKQEFAFNRSLLYEGLNSITKKFYENQINVTDDFDHNLYDMNVEKLKISFRGFYGLFDKISFLLNKYFKLEIDDNEVNFNRIWREDKYSKKINPKFINLNNFAIKGLYLINRDINFTKKDKEDNKNEFYMSLEPELKDIAEIRNHLEHKFLMVKAFKSIEDSDREREYYKLTEDELINKTIRLAQLTREAIIYTSLAIHIEEREFKMHDELSIGHDLEIYQK